MTDREEFEKWFNDNYPNPELLDDYTEDFMLGAWQARGELDAVRIKKLEDKLAIAFGVLDSIASDIDTWHSDKSIEALNKIEELNK